MGVYKMLVLNCQKMLEINCHFLLESTCRLQSAVIYSLIETAKANGLNVYAYLEYLLLYMPGSDWQRYPEELDDLMPWSPDVQENCK